LKALPSDILGRRESESHAKSNAAMPIAVIVAHGRRVVDDYERTDHYAALRWFYCSREVKKLKRRSNPLACSQNTETTRKLFVNWVLKALPSDNLGRREGKSRAESDAATTLSAMVAYGRRVLDDCERTDHYAALRW
jgi:hypothetical protein